jgi:uncharacterized protein YutE (UPF0331/DUF86 family)
MDINVLYKCISGKRNNEMAILRNMNSCRNIIIRQLYSVDVYNVVLKINQFI